MSAVLLLSIRHDDSPPPAVADREPVLDEIRHGLRLVRHDPTLRAFAIAQMLLAAQWGVFGAVFFLFALEDLGLSPAIVGLIAAVGGGSSFIGALVATRANRRWGVGPVAIAAALLAGVGNLFIPLAPPGLPILAILCLLAQQLIADLGRDGLRRDRRIGAPDLRPRSRAREGCVNVPGACRGGSIDRHPRGGSAGRGHRPARDGIRGAGRRVRRGFGPVAVPVRILREPPAADERTAVDDRAAAEIVAGSERDQPAGA
ncbi:MAG: MFS transporter [Candidatus Limnocylindrales bacterium]